MQYGKLIKKKPLHCSKPPNLGTIWVGEERSKPTSKIKKKGKQLKVSICSYQISMVLGFPRRPTHRWREVAQLLSLHWATCFTT